MNNPLVSVVLPVYNGEKYLAGSGGVYYMLMTDGELYRWGGSVAASTLVDTLDAHINDVDAERLSLYVGLLGNQLHDFQTFTGHRIINRAFGKLTAQTIFNDLR